MILLTVCNIVHGQLRHRACMCELFYPNVSPLSPLSTLSRDVITRYLEWLCGRRNGTSSSRSFSLFSDIGRSFSTVRLAPSLRVAFLTFPFPAGILLTAVWDPRAGCVITSTNNSMLSATFIYSMCFDFIVLCLTGYKLAASGNRSRVVNLIFQDGLVYFFVA
jgi:hypothetical protein